MLTITDHRYTVELTENEGSPTSIIHHTLSLSDGTETRWTERNIFDFGRVINPDYPVIEGAGSGGLVISFDRGPLAFYNYRELTEGETTAWRYLIEHGYYTRAGIRMDSSAEDEDMPTPEEAALELACEKGILPGAMPADV